MSGTEGEPVKKKKDKGWFLRRVARRDKVRSFVEKHHVNDGDVLYVHYSTVGGGIEIMEGVCRLSRGIGKKILGIVIGEVPIPLEMILDIKLVKRKRLARNKKT